MITMDYGDEFKCGKKIRFRFYARSALDFESAEDGLKSYINLIVYWQQRKPMLPKFVANKCDLMGKEWTSKLMGN